MPDVNVPGIGKFFICDRCLRGEHLSYGFDHRTGEVDHRDCKNLSPDGKHQCACNPDWPEIMTAINEDKRK